MDYDFTPTSIKLKNFGGEETLIIPAEIIENITEPEVVFNYILCKITKSSMIKVAGNHRWIPLNLKISIDVPDNLEDSNICVAILKQTLFESRRNDYSTYIGQYRDGNGDDSWQTQAMKDIYDNIMSELFKGRSFYFDAEIIDSSGKTIWELYKCSIEGINQTVKDNKLIHDIAIKYSNCISRV